MAKKKEYKKLPGKKRNPIGFSTLWLGPDHLLSIDSSLYDERYKRFYYKDIQAITACKINSWKITNIILALLSALLLWLSFHTGVAGSAFSRFMSALFFLCFLGYLFWGPSLECYIKTAIQIEKLPSLYQYRQFKKALALIKPKIEAAQGFRFTTSEDVQTDSVQAPGNTPETAGRTTASSNPYKVRYN